ncbi:MAG: trypsin-like peptidase domain-containing protein [Candidatus Hydrogenedentes bacterium]|nr:trypsin-like peptidase domain-containing protein [Candidatus Hydrogenedentota bacterium]
MKQAASILLIVLCVAGCAGRQRLETKTMERKAASLADYGPESIQAIVPFPEAPGSDTDVRGIAPTTFLAIHSGVLLSGDGLDEDEFLAQFEERQETRRDRGIDLELNIQTEALGGAGACVPVSNDGYFLTASHVLDYTDTYVIYFTSDETHTYARSARCRLVERYGSDLAVLHVDIKTPRYLRLADEPLTKGDEVFGGNVWVGQAAAGKYLREIEGQYVTSRREVEGTFIYTDMPALPGDSGSALINRKGELCGIIVSGAESERLLGPISVRRDYAIAAPLYREAIVEVIARDRTENGL